MKQFPKKTKRMAYKKAKGAIRQAPRKIKKASKKSWVDKFLNSKIQW